LFNTSPYSLFYKQDIYEKNTAMPKTLKPTIWTLIVICPLLFSFIADLEYRDVLDGDLKMLIPGNFIHVPKGAYKLEYPGDKSPDDFYCNKDTSESIGFLKIPVPVGNFDWCRQMMQEAILSNASKTYFNDITTINGNKVYLVTFEGMDAGKLKYGQLFVISVKNTAIMGNNLQHKV
jgi:hypothetical protein